jgi:hypothetical protein
MFELFFFFQGLDEGKKKASSESWKRRQKIFKITFGKVK